MLDSAIGCSEGPAAATRRREHDAAMLRQIITALGCTELLEILRARTDDAPDLADLSRHQARVAQRTNANRDIDLLGVQVDGAVRQGNANTHIGVAPLKLDECRRQVLHAERHRRVDAQEPARLASRSGDLMFKAVDSFEKPTPRVEVGLPFRRQRQLSRRAVDEPNAEPRLQSPDQLGDRRRRQAQIVRGNGKCAAFDGAHEHTHLGQLIHNSCLQFTKDVPRSARPPDGIERIYPGKAR